MIRFKNWFVETRLGNYRALELATNNLCGNVYGHSLFDDGSFIHTSPIVGIEDRGDHKDVITRSGSRYSVFPEDVHPEAERQFPNYYKRLSMKEEL